MARYDVYDNPASSGYLIEVQADLLDDLNTRVVIPLVPYTPKLKVVRRLNPVFIISDKQFALFTHLMGTVPRARLGEPRMNLAKRHDDITAALDMLFQGF